MWENILVQAKMLQNVDNVLKIHYNVFNNFLEFYFEGG